MLSYTNIYSLKQMFRYYDYKDDTFLLYMQLIGTIFLAPICLLLDIVLSPFEIGYLIFKKVMNKVGE